MSWMEGVANRPGCEMSRWGDWRSGKTSIYQTETAVYRNENCKTCALEWWAIGHPVANTTRPHHVASVLFPNTELLVINDTWPYWWQAVPCVHEGHNGNRLGRGVGVGQNAGWRINIQSLPNDSDQQQQFTAHRTGCKSMTNWFSELSVIWCS